MTALQQITSSSGCHSVAPITRCTVYHQTVGNNLLHFMKVYINYTYCVGFQPKTPQTRGKASTRNDHSLHSLTSLGPYLKIRHISKPQTNYTRIPEVKKTQAVKFQYRQCQKMHQATLTLLNKFRVYHD